MSTVPHEDVVAAFNVLGYQASFAAVAERLGNGTTAGELYDLYPSREALAEAWLSEVVPTLPQGASVRSLFAGLMFGLTSALGRQRDFSRAWLAAAMTNPAPGLLSWQLLHVSAQGFFRSGLQSVQGSIALPPPLVVADVIDDLADAMCGAAAALLVAWQADRSASNGDSRAAIDAAACLFDALLTRRTDFLDTSLLVHLHRMTALPREQFVKPLVDMLLPPARVQRLGNAPALADLLRNLLPPHTTGTP